MKSGVVGNYTAFLFLCFDLPSEARLYALRFLLAARHNPNEFGYALAPQRRLLRLGIVCKQSLRSA